MHWRCGLAFDYGVDRELLYIISVCLWVVDHMIMSSGGFARVAAAFLCDLSGAQENHCRPVVEPHSAFLVVDTIELLCVTVICLVCVISRAISCHFEDGLVWDMTGTRTFIGVME